MNVDAEIGPYLFTRILYFINGTSCTKEEYDSFYYCFNDAIKKTSGLCNDLSSIITCFYYL